MDVTLYLGTVGGLVLGLAVGYSLGWVEGISERWLYKRVLRPLLGRMRRHA